MAHVGAAWVVLPAAPSRQEFPLWPSSGVARAGFCVRVDRMLVQSLFMNHKLLTRFSSIRGSGRWVG